MRTITKAAEDLGVSRTKIYSLIERLDIKTKRGSKTNRIEDADFEKMRQIILDEKSDAENSPKERLNEVLQRDRNLLYNDVSDREYTDLKERIEQLEKQIDIKDQQLKEQSGQLTDAMKANSTLVESNTELSRVTTQLNLMVYKALKSPSSEVAATVELNKESSWFKRIFKKNR